MAGFGRFKFGGSKRKQWGNESQDITTMEKRVSQNIKNLHKCTNYASKKALVALKVLVEVTSACIDQPDSQKVIASCAVENHYPQLFTKMWESLGDFITQNHVDAYKNRYHVYTMISTYRNFTDFSSEFSSELGKYECIPILIGVLDNSIQDLMSDDVILERTFAILVNIVQRFPDNNRVFRRVNAVSVLEKCLKLEKLKNLTVQIDALIVFAFIADDTKVGKLVETVDGAVVRLVLKIKEAIDTEDHRVDKSDRGDYSASALELLKSLNKLAVNDAIKVEIAHNGGIPVFTRMLQEDFSEDEHIAAVKALWNLAFVKVVRISTELQESIKSLERLAMSNIDNLKLQHVCTYAMREIKGGIPVVLPVLPDPISPPTYEESVSQPTQIMISYQWDSQEETLKIKDRLEKAGYKVWMDVTNLSGSIYEEMAKAVDQSSIILVCMSEKYKQSESCRAEAHYAVDLKKTIIPLRMVQDYKADGWLKMLMRDRLYYDCCSIDQVDCNMDKVLSGIKAALSVRAVVKVDDEVIKVDDEVVKVDDELDGQGKVSLTIGPEKVSPPKVLNSFAYICQHLPPIEEPEELIEEPDEPIEEPNDTSASQWSREDVQDWLNDSNLSELCESFQSYDGSYLQDMYSDCCKDKTCFKDELLKTDHGIDNPQTRWKVVMALNKAFKE